LSQGYFGSVVENLIEEKVGDREIFSWQSR
jgi:hypothetical protein